MLLRQHSRTFRFVVAPALAVLAIAGGVCWPQRGLSHETLTTTVLFDREIVRILNRHCVMCHAEKGPSFPLETYEQTWVQARKIRASVIARRMPPWPAFPGYGQFLNDNSLTLRETQFIVSWVEGSGPRNAGTVFTNTADPNAVPRQEVRTTVDFGHWEFGEPQLKCQLPESVVEAGQSDEVRRTIIDPELRSKSSLRALEFMPSDRRVIRAVFFTVQKTGQWIGSWTPWHGFVDLPKHSAWALPIGTQIVAEIHYRGTSERVVERGVVGLFFAEQPVRNTVSDLVLDAKAETPHGAGPQKVIGKQRLASDIDALAIRLEFQLGIQSVEVSARKPDGTTEVMLFAKNLRSDWPTPYLFKNPVHLPKGSELSVTAYYVNDGDPSQSHTIRLTLSKVNDGV
jgi:hypothetical protein